MDADKPCRQAEGAGFFAYAKFTARKESVLAVDCVDFRFGLLASLRVAD